MQSRHALRTHHSTVSLQSEVAAFASSLALQSATFNLFILLSFLVLHTPTQSAPLAQTLREATSPSPLAALELEPGQHAERAFDSRPKIATTTAGWASHAVETSP